MRDAIDGTAAMSAAFKDYRGATQGFRWAGRDRQQPGYQNLFRQYAERARRIKIIQVWATRDKAMARGGGRTRSAEVNLRVDLNLIAPRLRRYARALVSAHPGPNEAADALVAAALRQVAGDGASLPPPDLEIEAYAALIELNREHVRAAELGGPSHGAGAWVKAGARGGAHPPERLPHIPASNDTLSSALLALKLEEREVLLLVALEGVAYARAARILKVSRAIVIARLARAREKLPANLQPQPASRGARAHPPHLRLVK